MSWVFAIIFLVIGVLNIILVHAVPGLFYIVLALFFLPPTNRLLQRKAGVSIPFAVKLVVFVLVMWATLGVGDLMEIFEKHYL